MKYAKFANEETANLRNEELLAMATKNNKPMRLGKTAKDRVKNAAHKNAMNKARRATWRNSDTNKGSKYAPFPVETCNGKRRR